MAEETNPFKKLEEANPAPERLKQKVMESVEFSQLMIEMADLFTDKMGKTMLDLFKTKKNDND
ncbi:hypothetical protein [Tunicatimonas pelagia]|uniref:hypothetical protein n=1 Tax=Tunicatimonas pelagia TaxID=931531 RepID=UPI0026653728|nr:hypothetical protein [Tunicatimonas pelagia]WKN41767.1 hypothetical protein P0M28_22270 [Tunicatimonas pelagia]